MKNLRDIKDRFHTELKQWFKKQTENIYENYYLYYLPATSQHDGGIIIAKDKPANPEYQLATGQSIRKDCTIEQNMIVFSDILNRLPVLSD